MLSHIIQLACIAITIGVAGGVDRGLLALFPACMIAGFSLLVCLILGIAREEYKRQQKGGNRRDF